MIESPGSEESGKPQDQKKPSGAIPAAPPSASSASSSSKPEVIKEKFLTVAKEKNQLESVIMQQSDAIKNLEKDKSDLTLSLKILSESHRKMKEKLLDFDILRNMEVSEFKKKIEDLITENKKLLSEKDRIFANLDRDQKNISVLDSQMSHTLLKEKEELESRLSSAIEELKHFRAQSSPEQELSLNKDGASFESPSERVRDDSPEAVLLDSRLHEMALDRDEAKAELYHARAEIDRLSADKTRAEEELQQKIAEYSEEIAGLRIDIDELTSAIESKIHHIDEVQTKVASLSEALMHKDTELHEQIPALLEKINSLSQSIDNKMEENSLFAKELFDLNVKISALNDELIRKDELFIEITDDYRKQKEEISSLHELHGQSLQDLQQENDRLIQEIDDFRSAASETEKIIKTNSDEKALLQRKTVESDARIDELARENTALAAAAAEKDKAAADLLQELSRSRDLAQQAAAETESQVAALRQQVLILNQQLLEKNEMLTVLSSDQLEEKELLSSREADLMKETSVLRDETDRLKEALNVREKQLTSYRSQIEESLQNREFIETQLRDALEKLRELAGEQERLSSLIPEKDRSLAQAMAECEAIRESSGLLEQRIFELEKASSGSEPASAPVDAEKDQLLRNVREYQETFEHLKDEIISLNRAIAEKEQQINQLNSDNIALISKTAEQQATLEQSQLGSTALENRLKEIQETGQLSENENQRLIDELIKQKTGMELLQKNKDLQIDEMKRELSSYAEALADLRSKLEQSMRENDSLRSDLPAAPETSEGRSQKKTETLPVRMMTAENAAPRGGKHSRPYALLATLLIVIIGATFYAYNTGLLVLADRTTVQPATPSRELSYEELFALLNRSAADGLKFQATLITEPLVLKSEEPADRSFFDFQHYLYFKVNVSAPREGLDPVIANDPYSRILLSAGSADVNPLPEKKVKGIKTFYRKEAPVSIIFYCAFPIETLAPDSTLLKLSLKKDAAPTTLVWDLRQLREHNLLP